MRNFDGKKEFVNHQKSRQEKNKTKKICCLHIGGKFANHLSLSSLIGRHDPQAKNDTSRLATF